MIDLPELPCPKEAYVIYSNSREKYSRGGCAPSWSTKPKTWSGLGPLKGHLAMFIVIEFIGKAPYWRKEYKLTATQPYDGCVIYDIVSKRQVSTVHEMYRTMIEARMVQDRKDQNKETDRLIKLIQKRNEEEYDRTHPNG
jgi:hypothetical protein